ncbi:hypothetical protein [Shimia sagamensis]
MVARQRDWQRSAAAGGEDNTIHRVKDGVVKFNKRWARCGQNKAL